MKNIVLILCWGIFLSGVVSCQDPIPGKVKIILVEHLTHNSVVIHSVFTDVREGVGLQFNGICVDKSFQKGICAQTYQGTNFNGFLESSQIGVSALEPDTRFIIRAYFETNEGIVYSDTMVIKTKPVDFMTDSRDGKKYPVKSYGNLVWMLQNLDFQTPGCLVFENNAEKTPSEFGKLYSYQEACIACPPGWHLPSDEEWKMLEEYVGIPGTDLDKTALRGSPAGAMMKEPGMRLWESESAKHSNNRSGFSVVPSGWYRTDKKEFTYSKTCAGFWSVSEDSKTAFLRFFYVNSDAVSRTSLETYSFLLSVRCVKN